MQKLRVAVLMGGPSSEHDVSLETGKTVLRSLDADKYEAFPVVVPKERDSTIELQKDGTDVAFIAMHGEYGEDGTVQAALKELGVPYTGSGVLASALGMHKPLSSRLLRDCGLAVPDFMTVREREFKDAPEAVMAEAVRKLGLPLVVKPADRGSSVGITVAHDADQLALGIAEALRHSREAMVQCYVKGREVTCSVLEDETVPEGVRALPPTEIVPKERPFFDYHSKYTAGASEEITPPRLPTATIRAIQEVALRTHAIIGCSGMSRTDTILGADGRIYVLEINTIPGMTPTSLLPQAAEAAGIPFPELLDRIIFAALHRTGNVSQIKS
ncbi:MAG: D-alanine--D-alanine ligase [Candidatus Liptonbacteria bacterium]|nr:D-alanine--D-alanine ligase [Candidatus Liptonbacteria bacterium]